ncbi:Hypothetical protein D9617_6g094960 [Elsinoe fawcettii]|nr:Hypothetical protein D9617_6g094960 [Elsinoe fawcettii]
MKSTSVRSISQFASKIHPQIALTRTESKRLLDSLKTSFRYQLDAAHEVQDGQASKQHRSALNHAERHVASVLTNPLLATSQIGQPHKLSNDNRHPIDVFNDCAANGTASLEIASQCLSAFHRSLRSLTSEQKRAEIARHQPGSKVLQWLWATGLAQSEALVVAQRLVSSVVALLLREGKEETIWKWLATADTSLQTHNAISDQTERTSAQASLLKQLTYWKVKSKKNDPSLAIDAFQRAANMIGVGEILPESLRPAGLLLIADVQRSKGLASSLPGAGNLVNFLETFQLWKLSDIEPAAIDIARLGLQHVGATYLEIALDITTRLDIKEARLSHDHYGTKVVRLLLALSEALQINGSKEQIRRFVGLLQKTQEPKSTEKHNSLLFREVQGLPRLLLQDVEAWSRPMPHHVTSAPG